MKTGSHKTYSGTIQYNHKMLWSAFADVVTVASIVSLMVTPWYFLFIMQGGH
jgi:hypothetical protein